MPVKHVLKICLLLCLLAGSLLACSVLPNVTYKGTPVTAPSTPVATSGQDTSLTMNVWMQAVPGAELRYEHWKSPGNNEDTVVIARFDLHRVHLSIGYQPNNPLLLSNWIKQTGALAAINGGYFDKDDRPTGLLISNGQATGSSYQGFGGMLAVDGQGNVSLRSLHDQPYDSASGQLQQATQSSPMFIINGKRTQFSANTAAQRRSVVAIDKQGRLLLIVSPGGTFSLDEFADLLVASDLSLQTALNLDGGASTGLYLNGEKQKVTIDPVSALPIAIIIK